MWKFLNEGGTPRLGGYVVAADFHGNRKGTVFTERYSKGFPLTTRRSSKFRNRECRSNDAASELRQSPLANTAKSLRSKIYTPCRDF